MTLRAITFDYWDTLYTGAVLTERMTLRQTALRRMLTDLGHEIGQRADRRGDERDELEPLPVVALPRIAEEIVQAAHGAPSFGERLKKWFVTEMFGPVRLRGALLA